MLIGLELPEIIRQLGSVTLMEAIGYGAGITGVLIVGRLLCTLGSSAFTVFISRWITTADNRPGWKLPLIFGWAGMRGVVSLAAALSIPFALSNGAQFPQRDLIIFITFIVIVLTLLVQGLTLPALIRKLKLGADPDYTLSPEERDRQLRKQLTGFSLAFLNDHFPAEVKKNPLLHQLCSRFYTDNDQLQHQGPYVQSEYREIYLKLLKKQRKYLNELNQSLENDEEIIRKYQTILDLEQEKLSVLYENRQ